MGLGIIGTGSYLPESILGINELAMPLGVDEAWIIKKFCGN